MAGLAGVGAESDLDLGRHAFHPGPAGCFAIVDMVSRKWIDTLVLGGGDRHPGAGDLRALRSSSKGLLDLLTDERLDLDPDDPRRPILLAVSDNGPPMTAEAPARSWR